MSAPGADCNRDLLNVSTTRQLFQAEGVETDAALSFLRDEACDAIQGYLLARPAPISTFTEHTSGKAAPAVSGTLKRIAHRAARRGLRPISIHAGRISLKLLLPH